MLKHLDFNDCPLKMPNVHSHYENLKVARDAPPEVIRAAYKSLSQKYHPDRNPENPDANRIMAILNTAFETLSDPDKRRRHDLWIAEAEGKDARDEESVSPKSRAFQVDEERIRQGSMRRNTSVFEAGTGFVRVLKDPNVSLIRKVGHVIAHVFRYWVAYGFAALVVVAILLEKDKTSTSGSKPYVQSPAPERSAPAYVRPLAAPNGAFWPTSSGYIQGYKRLHADGLSTVTVDNSRNDGDMFVKLVSIGGTSAYPVRTFFIAAGEKFSVNNVRAGMYDVRYRDLNSGGLTRSEKFNLEETSTDDGVQFSRITLTLYKVRNGNMQTYGLSEAEF